MNCNGCNNDYWSSGGSCDGCGEWFCNKCLVGQDCSNCGNTIWLCPDCVVSNVECSCHVDEHIGIKQDVIDAIEETGEVTYDTVWSVLELALPLLRSSSSESDFGVIVDKYYDYALGAFSVCPRCEKIIETLIEKVSGFNRAEFRVVKETNTFKIVADYGFESDDAGLWYECPECEEIIFEDFAEALAFLKMERE